jgi:hypothetical protein
MTMDLEELQRRWQEQDRTLQASLRLNTRIVRALALDKVRSATGRWSLGIAIELGINAVAVLWLGSYLGDRIGAPRFALPAAALLAVAIAVVGSSVAQLVRLRRIDHGVPVIAIQKQLEAVRLSQLRTTRSILLLAPLLWTPLQIVALDRFLGIDAYATLGLGYLAANLAFGVAVIPLLLWLARRARLGRFTHHLDGSSLTAARRALEALAAFEAEAAI